MGAFVIVISVALTTGYLAGGRRAFKTSSAGTKYYLYDGKSPICEIDSTGAVTALNTWGVEGLVSRDPLGFAWFTNDDGSGYPR